jgi:hypothetical protein
MMQKKCQKINRSAKRNFEQKLAKNVKENSKSFFAYIRNKQRTKDRVGPQKIIWDKWYQMIKKQLIF